MKRDFKMKTTTKAIKELVTKEYNPKVYIVLKNMHTISATLIAEESDGPRLVLANVYDHTIGSKLSGTHIAYSKNVNKIMEVF